MGRTRPISFHTWRSSIQSFPTWKKKRRKLESDSSLPRIQRLLAARRGAAIRFNGCTYAIAGPNVLTKSRMVEDGSVKRESVLFSSLMRHLTFVDGYTAAEIEALVAAVPVPEEKEVRFREFLAEKGDASCVALLAALKARSERLEKERERRFNPVPAGGGDWIAISEVLT